MESRYEVRLLSQGADAASEIWSHVGEVAAPNHMEAAEKVLKHPVWSTLDGALALFLGDQRYDLR